MRRLRFARLVLAGERRPATELLHLFLVEGAPFAFPPVPGPRAIGTATAHSAPAFQALVESSDGFVWADASGASRGQSLIPLYPGAPALPARNESLYELLAIVDALRVGSTRVRKIAAELLRERLTASRS